MKHQGEVRSSFDDFASSNDNFYATCSCGWDGRGRTTGDEALQDLSDHYAEVGEI